MLNIISKSICSRSVSGPKKVADNLIKGLRLLNYPYVLNHRLDACQRLWIHDDLAALKEAAKLGPEIKIVAGPNLILAPRYVPKEADLSKMVLSFPTKWIKDFWMDFGFNSCPIEICPAGIDTNEFCPETGEKKQILVYFKQRSSEELAAVEKVLHQKRLAYKILECGKYSEKTFKQMLAKARFIIWLGRHESQGIALEEALATDTPMLVCEVASLGHWTASQKEKGVFNERELAYKNVTAAEYFDNRCGIKIKNLVELPEALDRMEAGLKQFRPRQYILESLSLEKQAREFLGIFEKYFQLPLESGYGEKILKQGYWINRSFKNRFNFFAKDMIKLMLKIHG